MKNVFTAILFLGFVIGFGQNKTAVKKETIKKTVASPKVITPVVDDKSSNNIGNGHAMTETDAEYVVDENLDYTQIFTTVQVNAVPPGGMNEYRKFISSSFRVPEVDQYVAAKIFLKFVVFEDGSLHDFQVVKETPSGLGLGEEAIRVFKTSGNWTPGQMNGKNVKQYYTFPVMIQILGSVSAKQSSEEVSGDTDYNKIFSSVQVVAEPPGGMSAFREFIGSNFKLPVVYQTTMGNVVARFVVWDDGSIRDIKIVYESPKNLGLGEEAIRLLMSSDKWKPGVYNNRNVKQYFTLPITIQITAEEKTQPIKN